jgi:Holliday junction resolvase RusA-like endonuclease
MKKRQKEYIQKYGTIPNDYYERFSYILEELNINEKDLKKIQKDINKIKNIKWIPINFIFYFVPEATPRARYSGFTKIFYVKNAQDNSEIFKEFIDNTQEFKYLITTSCKFYCDIFKPISDLMSKSEKVLSELKLISDLSKPDWDNLGKTYSDMVQNHLLLDDSLIVDGRVRKFYSFKPRIEIHIEYMEKYDCKYNKRKVEKWNCYKENKDKIIERDSII